MTDTRKYYIFRKKCSKWIHRFINTKDALLTAFEDSFTEDVIFTSVSHWSHSPCVLISCRDRINCLIFVLVFGTLICDGQGLCGKSRLLHGIVAPC